jgi:hypothetical protein
MPDTNALAANDDGSDIFMGQSLDDLDNSLAEEIIEEETKEEQETAEESNQKTNKEDKKVKSESINENKKSTKSDKFTKLNSVIKNKKIILISISLLSIFIISSIYYFYFFNTKDLTQDKEPKIIKKIDLSIINHKRLNRKLQILLEDEQERLTKVKVIKQNNIEKEKKIHLVSIQIAILHEKIDIEFSQQLDSLNLEIQSCYKKNMRSIFVLVDKRDAPSILSKIQNNIARDAYINYNVDIENLCK